MIRNIIYKVTIVFAITINLVNFVELIKINALSHVLVTKMNFAVDYGEIQSIVFI